MIRKVWRWFFPYRFAAKGEHPAYWAQPGRPFVTFTRGKVG
jgi:hypothetical protein